ncbi:minor curlin subunit CsgB nucleation component of curlin monomers [Vibrio maritimus]|uniref:Minor curlin subunit CsgB nucleation component of curlin monomers n=1 Tax=Vibrio maritimus TaxID=990268 RepID=A0A090T227_9VIBR|nr:minor curlin subunit CsgB nucleation component of curlin monomers [Vibrio maritimus]
MNSHYKLSKTILWTPILMLAIAQSGSVQGASFWYAPNGGLSAPPGTFLDGVSEDVLEDYDAFVTGTSSDLDNYSEVHSFNVTNSAALIVQEGGGASNAGNKAKIIQRDGARNTALVTQSGRGNTAYISQDGSDNAAYIGQLGRNGEALIEQNGNNNLALVGQANLGFASSQLSISQQRDNNIAVVAGAGAANLGISQDGGDSAIINASASMRVYINQAN